MESNEQSIAVPYVCGECYYTTLIKRDRCPTCLNPMGVAPEQPAAQDGQMLEWLREAGRRSVLGFPHLYAGTLEWKAADRLAAQQAEIAELKRQLSEAKADLRGMEKSRDFEQQRAERAEQERDLLMQSKPNMATSLVRMNHALEQMTRERDALKADAERSSLIDDLRKLIDSDRLACTFQTMAQYRTFLLKSIDAARRGA